MSAADWTVRAAMTQDVPAIIALFAEIAREGSRRDAIRMRKPLVE